MKRVVQEPIPDDCFVNDAGFGIRDVESVIPTVPIGMTRKIAMQEKMLSIRRI